MNPTPNLQWIVLSLLTLLLWLPAAPAQAHALQPAYLSLQEQASDQYAVFWKVPFAGEGSLAPLDEQPELPPVCQVLTPPATSLLAGGVLTQWTVDCGPEGLQGQPLTIRGLDSAINDVLVRVETGDGKSYSEILRPDQPTYTLPARGTPAQIAWAYLRLGIQHIWTGYDHLLFVLGLVLLVANRWALVKTITAFTLAHSLTLGAATLGLVTVPQTPVEAVIALSIVFLATELVRQKQGRSGLTERSPWVVAFIFGLLHGLGFAGALAEVGLPQAAIPMALLLFFLGVEVGQLAFVGGVLVLLILGRTLRSEATALPGWLTPYAIGSVSAFLVFQRVAAFWPVD